MYTHHTLQIDEKDYSEIYLNYYDIFVRNAFGNYFDVLKEVSYSPMMAEMLSFLESKSTAYVLEDSGSKAYPGGMVFSSFLSSLLFFKE